MVTVKGSSDSAYPLGSSGNAQSFAQQDLLDEHPSVRCSFKRCVDIIGACIGLLLTLPVACFVAIANQMYSPGPLFYTQVRCGLNGHPFKMWKFRSMVVGADRIRDTIPNQAKGQVFKHKNDPRVTPVGRFLRRTSLDELPQFWNVLKGDMSLVGTRPPTLDEVEKYQTHHWRRLCVKPGITGEWQTNGRSAIEDFEDIVLMDLAYQQKWSLRYDVLLLLKTVLVVLKREGAY